MLITGISLRTKHCCTMLRGGELQGASDRNTSNTLIVFLYLSTCNTAFELDTVLTFVRYNICPTAVVTMSERGKFIPKLVITRSNFVIAK